MREYKGLFAAGVTTLLITVCGQGAQAEEGQPYQPPPDQVQPGYPQPGQPGYPQGGQPGYPQAQPGDPNQPYPPPVYQPSPNYMPQQRPVLRYEMRPRVGLIIGGAVTLGVSWGITALTTALIQDVCNLGDSGCASSVWPLYIPVAGPWIQMGYTGSASFRALLVFDGLVQGGGLAMLIAGAVSRQRVPVYAQRVQVTPYALAGGSGLLVSGRF